jgi:type IV pilus secretin PilQ/predicted competence protein
MKIKSFYIVLLLFCVFAVLSGYTRNDQPLANINKISVLPEEFNAKIIVESSLSPFISKTYYSPEAPSTVVVELNDVNTSVEPQIAQEKDPLVESLKIEKTGAEQCRLLIGLKERVPYRISSTPEYTIIELNRIQKELGQYVLFHETEESLKKTARRQIVFKDINVSEEQNRIHVMTKLSETPVVQVFVLGNPLRLVADFFDTTLSADSTLLNLEKNLGIEKVRARQFQVLSPYTIARMAFDLTEPRYYTIAAKAGELDFSFYKDDAAQAPPLTSTPFLLPIGALALKPPTPEAVPTKPEAIKEEAAPKVEKPAEAVAPAPKPTPPAAAAEQAPLAKPSPPLPVPEQVPEEQFKPKTISETRERYTGELVSLKFKDADLRDVILSLGYQFGFNVVFDPEVRGTVTCDLVSIPWDQALDLLLKQNKMGKVIEGNILRIASIATLTREDEENRKFIESRELAQPVSVKNFTLSYAKAKDVFELIKGKISARGGAIVDERTNVLVIEDVTSRLDLLEKLISLFDAPNPQVSIEARIIEASSNFARNLGVQLGFKSVMDPFYGNPTNLKFPNKILVDGTPIPVGTETKGLGGPLGGYAINLPAPSFSSALGLSFGNIADTFRIDMAISALETTGQGKIISCPTVTTQNYKQAEIIQGQQIPVQTTANFTTTTRYQNAALELRATPQITAEGTIIMDIEIQNNSADFAHLVNGIPPIITQRASTRVLVNDGGTAVIGGIYRTEDSITRENVPFLHQIPILGNLFKNSARYKTNRELLIFITPRIIKQ